MIKLKWITNFNPLLYEPKEGEVAGPPRASRALSSDDIADCGYKGLYFAGKLLDVCDMNNYENQMDKESDGEYVLYEDYQKEIDELQTVIKQLKDKLNIERIAFVDAINERDEFRKYKDILDSALAAAEKLSFDK